MTRDEAFEAFLEAVKQAIPEGEVDWPARRALLRDTALHYAHAAVDEILTRLIKPVVANDA